jgi:ABC-2 type transport system permease protein
MLSFAAVVVEEIVLQILHTLVFGLTGWGSSLTFLSPLVKLIRTDFMPVYSELLAADSSRQLLGSVYTGWGWLAAYAAASVLFLLLALALYRRRRLETAGDFIAVKALSPVFKYCLPWAEAWCLPTFCGMRWTASGALRGPPCFCGFS